MTTIPGGRYSARRSTPPYTTWRLMPSPTTGPTTIPDGRNSNRRSQSRTRLAAKASRSNAWCLPSPTNRCASSPSSIRRAPRYNWDGSLASLDTGSGRTWRWRGPIVPATWRGRLRTGGTADERDGRSLPGARDPSLAATGAHLPEQPAAVVDLSAGNAVLARLWEGRRRAAAHRVGVLVPAPSKAPVGDPALGLRRRAHPCTKE